jgi:iron complex transport system ATP-binding protein
MTQQAHILQVQGLSFAYRPDRPAVLSDVSFSAQMGTLLVVLGPNGSGKTTLLRCLLRLLRIRAGEIILDGRAIRSYSPEQLARLMAYVPQIPQSAFAFTVAQIVMLGRTPHLGALGFETDLDRRVSRSAMEMTGTLEFADRALEELSGGEAQRVMIARAIAQQPQVLLLDEPTSHLDLKNQLAIYRMMVRLAHDWPMAVVCVSHDINMAGRFADELLLMRRGAVAAHGPPASVLRSDVLASVYEVEVQLLAGPDGLPLVIAR